QNDEDDDSNRHSVAGHSSAAEGAHDAHEDHPACLPDGVLNHTVDGNADKSLHHVPIRPKLPVKNLYPAIAAEQNPELIDNTDASPDGRRDRRTRHTESRKGAESKNEAGIEQQIDEIRKP